MDLSTKQGEHVILDGEILYNTDYYDQQQYQHQQQQQQQTPLNKLRAACVATASNKKFLFQKYVTLNKETSIARKSLISLKDKLKLLHTQLSKSEVVTLDYYENFIETVHNHQLMQSATRNKHINEITLNKSDSYQICTPPKSKKTNSFSHHQLNISPPSTQTRLCKQQQQQQLTSPRSPSTLKHNGTKQPEWKPAFKSPQLNEDSKNNPKSITKIRETHTSSLSKPRTLIEPFTSTYHTSKVIKHDCVKKATISLNATHTVKSLTKPEFNRENTKESDVKVEKYEKNEVEEPVMKLVETELASLNEKNHVDIDKSEVADIFVKSVSNIDVELSLTVPEPTFVDIIEVDTSLTSESHKEDKLKEAHYVDLAQETVITTNTNKSSLVIQVAEDTSLDDNTSDSSFVSELNIGCITKKESVEKFDVVEVLIPVNGGNHIKESKNEQFNEGTTSDYTTTSIDAHSLETCVQVNDGAYLTNVPEAIATENEHHLEDCAQVCRLSEELVTKVITNAFECLNSSVDQYADGVPRKANDEFRGEESNKILVEEVISEAFISDALDNVTKSSQIQEEKTSELHENLMSNEIEEQKVIEKMNEKETFVFDHSIDLNQVKNQEDVERKEFKMEEKAEKRGETMVNGYHNKELLLEIIEETSLEANEEEFRELIQEKTRDENSQSFISNTEYSNPTDNVDCSHEEQKDEQQSSLRIYVSNENFSSDSSMEKSELKMHTFEYPFNSIDTLREENEAKADAFEAIDSQKTSMDVNMNDVKEPIEPSFPHTAKSSYDYLDKFDDTNEAIEVILNVLETNKSLSTEEELPSIESPQEASLSFTEKFIDPHDTLKEQPLFTVENNDVTLHTIPEMADETNTTSLPQFEEKDEKVDDTAEVNDVNDDEKVSLQNVDSFVFTQNNERRSSCFDERSIDSFLDQVSYTNETIGESECSQLVSDYADSVSGMSIKSKKKSKNNKNYYTRKSKKLRPLKIRDKSVERSQLPLTCEQTIMKIQEDSIEMKPNEDLRSNSLTSVPIISGLSFAQILKQKSETSNLSTQTRRVSEPHKIKQEEASIPPFKVADVKIVVVDRTNKAPLYSEIIAKAKQSQQQQQRSQSLTQTNPNQTKVVFERKASLQSQSNGKSKDHNKQSIHEEPSLKSVVIQNPWNRPLFSQIVAAKKC